MLRALLHDSISKATEKLNEVAGNLKEKGENLAEKAKGKLEGLKK